jgi:hypothetical protein
MAYQLGFVKQEAYVPPPSMEDLEKSSCSLRASAGTRDAEERADGEERRASQVTGHPRRRAGATRGAVVRR